MRSNTRVLLAFASILLIALCAGCGNKAPTVQIIGPKDDAILANTAIQFTAVAEDSDDDSLTYRWLFGDGHNSSEQSVLHTYSEGGDYTVNLAVSDRKHTVQTAIEIHINIRPSSNISWTVGEDAEWSSGPIEGTAPLHLELDGSSSWDGDGQIVSYDWVFHEGTTVSGYSSEYTYDSPGTYSVMLRVVDDLGASAERSIEAVIHPSLAQSLETVRALELMLSPLRSDLLTSMFRFSRELLQVQSGAVVVVFETYAERIYPLADALEYRADGCDQYFIDIDPRKFGCETMCSLSQISLAFEAALACHTARLPRCTPARSAKVVLGFEELIALTSHAASLSRCVHVLSSSDDTSALQLDTAKLPSVLLNLPISFVSEFDRLSAEFEHLAMTEQQLIDVLVNGESPAPGWDDAGWAWTTGQVRRIDTLNTYLEQLSTEHDEFLQQIRNEVRNRASSQECEPSLQEEVLSDSLSFGIVLDNSHGTLNHPRLALVYSLIGTGQESQPIEFALLRQGDAHVVRVLPHIRIEALDLEYQHPDLQAFYEKHGLPGVTIIEPFYEIQYEQFTLGWYVTPFWDAPAIQPTSRLTVLFDVHDQWFSQTAGSCTISIAATSEPPVDMTFYFAIVPDIFDWMAGEMTMTVEMLKARKMLMEFENSNYMRIVRGDLNYGYRVVSPGVYP